MVEQRDVAEGQLRGGERNDSHDLVRARCQCWRAGE
jgi:hypothetical protein